MCGELAQMVECLLSMQEVLGLIPRFSSCSAFSFSFLQVTDVNFLTTWLGLQTPLYLTLIEII